MSYKEMESICEVLNADINNWHSVCLAIIINYRKTSNIRCTLVGNNIVDHSDVVGASPVGAAPTTSSFSAQYLASMEWAKTNVRRGKKYLKFRIWCALY